MIRLRHPVVVTFALLIPFSGTGTARGDVIATAPISTARAPTTVTELITPFERWVVAIDVRRSKDLPAPRINQPGGPIAVTQESKDYFKRPDGVVTGVLLDKEGHVLTSFYNVGGTLTSIDVRLPGGENRRARLVATDPFDDLALLRLEGEKPEWSGEWSDPPWATEAPTPGSIVFALGRAPDPKRLTVTEGIVSARERNGSRTLQTDAKLNYGNVGGPLIDLNGKIVGVTGFVGHIYPFWGLNSGIGFAAKVGTVQRVLPRMREGRNIGPPEVAFLGIRSDPESTISGAPVEEVVEGTPAAGAGLQRDDVIIEFNGQRVTNFNHLRRLIYLTPVKSKVNLKVRRGKEVLELTVNLQKRPTRS